MLAELQQHTAAGRLGIEEFSERAAAVYRSRTMGELAALTADLPPIPPPGANASMRMPRTLVVALVLVAVAIVLLGLATAAHAGPMMGALGCG